jgi:hypothetical protein
MKEPSNIKNKAKAVLNRIEKSALPTPNVNNAQAKLLELEQYLQSMGLNTEKWQAYLAEARRSAAVGDDTFNATPELDRDDMEYLREKQRKERQKNVMQSMMGGNGGY